MQKLKSVQENEMPKTHEDIDIQTDHQFQVRRINIVAINKILVVITKILVVINKILVLINKILVVILKNPSSN